MSPGGSGFGNLVFHRETSKACWSFSDGASGKSTQEPEFLPYYLIFLMMPLAMLYCSIGGVWLNWYMLLMVLGSKLMSKANLFSSYLASGVL